MTTPTFSGFLSNFASTTGTSGTYTDILSTFGQAATSQTPTSGGSTNPSTGCYFYIGNILIQSSTQVMNDRPTGENYTQTYPILFSSAPYVVLLTGTSLTGNYTVTATFLSTGTSSFNFRIGTNDGNITWLAIGPA